MIFAIKYWKAKDLPCASGVWKYHVKLLMFSPGSGLSVTSPGMLNICFRHARPSIVNMWFRHARPWPGENRNNFPWCFLHKSILHQSCFPSLFFFYEHLGRFCINFCIPLLFVQNAKKIKTRNWKGKAGALETYSYIFYLWTFTKILYIFVSILLLFVLG